MYLLSPASKKIKFIVATSSKIHICAQYRKSTTLTLFIQNK